jgi:C-terminal processing protease CtpA/Prc
LDVDESFVDGATRRPLGLDLRGAGLRVSRVLSETPAPEKSKLLAGDVVVALEDRRTDDPKVNAWAAFDRLAGKEVRVTVVREGAEKEVLMTPSAGLGQAVYNDRVERRQDAVAKATEGKVGYVHIAAMAEAEFLRFERELFAEGDGKSALIIDVRGNGGGSTADWLFTVLTQADHAITRPRGGGDGYPQDRRIFSAWTKPVVVLCDEFSYSNAEIFSHGIKTLKRGSVVGSDDLRRRDFDRRVHAHGRLVVAQSVPRLDREGQHEEHGEQRLRARLPRDQHARRRARGPRSATRQGDRIGVEGRALTPLSA